MKTVIDLCVKKVGAKARLIDCVVVSGSTIPMKLYSVDLDFRSIAVDNLKPLGIVFNTRNRFKVRQYIENEKNSKLSEDLDLTDVFESDVGIAIMRKRYTIDFFQLFNMGYHNYSQGEWQVARRMLNSTKTKLGMEDGPSSCLLRFMESGHNFEAPKEWVGVRDLPVGEAS